VYSCKGRKAFIVVVLVFPLQEPGQEWKNLVRQADSKNQPEWQIFYFNKNVSLSAFQAKKINKNAKLHFLDCAACATFRHAFPLGRMAL
jgi:hypothetical protein